MFRSFHSLFSLVVPSATRSTETIGLLSNHVGLDELVYGKHLEQCLQLQILDVAAAAATVVPGFADHVKKLGFYPKKEKPRRAFQLGPFRKNF